MHRVLSTRLAPVSTFIVALIGVICATLFLTTNPATAAPSAQAQLPDFTLNANTLITVTIAITDGQVIVVPVDLTFVAENSNGQVDLSIITDVEQQAGMFIGVSPENAVVATFEQPQAEDDTAGAPSPNNASGEGTHVANTNSNQRAGPGTNFAIVGRVPRGEAVTVVGENENGTWLQLDNGNWVAEFLLDPIPNNSNNDNNDGDNDQSDNQDDEQTNSSPEDVEAETTTVSAPVESAPAAADQVVLADYLLNLTAIGAGAADAVATLADLVEDPQPLNPVWRNDIAAQLAVLSATLDQYLTLTPVPGYEDLHTQVTEVSLTCEQAVDYLVAGLSGAGEIEPALATQSVQACAAQAAGLATVVESLQ